ncbi:hypothetical protein ACFW9O_17580 [Streptomyces sp. NPDC059499]|uniref:hypothetical protein n=1 Tax=Streptomyces sp. NPDC059499 TaxID=3346852 RepID=UPI00368EFA7E
MNARRVNAAAGVILAAQKNRQTAAELARWRERTEEAEVGEAQLRGQVRGLKAYIAELEALKPAPIQTCQSCGAGYDYGHPCSVCEFKKRVAAELAKPSAEDPHDSPRHHTYELGRDLPEVTWVDPCHPCGCPKRFDRHSWGCPALPEVTS